jgi:hypothetical protein
LEEEEDIRMVARRRRHKDGCKEGEDVRMVARRTRHKDGCKEMT